ncbi:hypothetical protein L6Q96_19420 [Candidatus Binatia bacterium]|nr:hypothetical protein [Candidatus Binatia bacterium]
MAQADLPILREIVRVVQTQGTVPERVHIQTREFEITYLDDHRQRIEEALRRHDGDRLNMLFGQLSSKVKYRHLRRVARVERGRKPQRASGARVEKPAAAKRGAKPAAKRGAKPTPKRNAKPAAKRATTAKRATGAATARGRAKGARKR